MNRSCGRLFSRSLLVQPYRSVNLLSLFRGQSVLPETSAPFTGILVPKGDLYYYIECGLVPNLGSRAVGTTDWGVARLLSQKTPPRPSPRMAMYALVTFARKPSFSIPLKYCDAICVLLFTYSLLCPFLFACRVRLLFSTRDLRRY